MTNQDIENLPEPVKKQRGSIRIMGIVCLAVAALYYVSLIGVVANVPPITSLFGTNPRVAIILGVIGTICLAFGIGTFHYQANNAERLKEMTYGQTDERYRLIRLKANAAMGTSFFTLVPFAIIGLKMTGHIDLVGMTVFLGVWIASLVVGAIALAYYQKRL